MKSEYNDNLALAALAAEAKRRDMSYGQLVSVTEFWEREKIIREYQEAKKKGKRRTPEKDPEEEPEKDPKKEPEKPKKKKTKKKGTA